MNESGKRIVIFPGTFDPITNGHLDVIKRGVDIFDELIIAVGENPDKRTLLPHDERVDIIREVIAEIPAVRVESFTGLTVDFARSVGAKAILRGIRNSSDLQFEFQVALTNRAVTGIETVFIMTSSEFSFTSSNLIRQIAQMGGDVSTLVPSAVLGHIKKRCDHHPGDPVDNGLHETE